jgi:hypothetical protein
MVYSGAWGKLIHEKNQKSKISRHCPFKGLSSQIETGEESFAKYLLSEAFHMNFSLNILAKLCGLAFRGSRLQN